MEDLTPPEDFLRFSEAVTLLAQGIWGGLRRPIPVRQFKSKYKKGSVGFGPWREQAGEYLRTAAIGGQVPVHVLSTRQPGAGCAEPTLTLVPSIVLAKLIPSRGSFPDHPRVSMTAVNRDGGLFRALNTGLLIVPRREFDVWYRRERAKGRWASQTSKSKKVGRPSKQTKSIRNAVTNALRKGKKSIAALRRYLKESGMTDVPSPDTLGRLVDQLYHETGEIEFFRTRRSRRMRT